MKPKYLIIDNEGNASLHHKLTQEQLGQNLDLEITIIDLDTHDLPHRVDTIEPEEEGEDEDYTIELVPIEVSNESAGE